ncbi:hypothetical protein [Sulfitobacter sp.]|uniref:hypothetical protein n=1 Tax=Sulfitobacter sp. TaxID=1903071 RepID=UPI003001E2B1
MATSTESINTLIEGYTDLKSYFESVRDGINVKVEALTASLSVTVYINGNVGSDEAAGGEETPVRTMREAVSRVPVRGFGRIIFKTSVTMSEKIDTRASGLLFEAYPGVTPALRSDWRVGDDTFLYPGQINFAGSYGSVAFNGVGMHFEEKLAGTVGDDFEIGVFMTNSITPPLFCGLFNCAITRDGGAAAFLISASSGTATLNVATSVTFSSSMNGFWFAGIPSGTQSNLTRYNTNITSL